MPDQSSSGSQYPNLNKPQHQGALFLIALVAQLPILVLIGAMAMYQSGNVAMAGVGVAVALFLFAGVSKLAVKLADRNAKRSRSE